MQAGSCNPPSSHAAGTVQEPAGDDARIVCLVPSITELLCDLGLSEQLVGRTGFCSHPREIVRTIPKVPPDTLARNRVGHAVEARLYAEDPANGFLPSTGTVRPVP